MAATQLIREFTGRSLLVAGAFVDVEVRWYGVVELTLKRAGGECMTALLEPHEAYELHRIALAASQAAGDRELKTMAAAQQVRVNVLLERIRQGLATCEDADELSALLDGQIEEIEVGLPAGGEEENEG